MKYTKPQIINTEAASCAIMNQQKQDVIADSLPHSSNAAYSADE